jgi:CheY-like chemotaxis protein
MPQMTGIEMLKQARSRAPGAKYLLLTAYADTEVAIEAINEIGLDYYLLKPWDPPGDTLFPVIHDLLEDWRQDNPDHSSDVRVVGHRWSERGYEIKTFLARNHVRYRWYDIERDAEARRLRDLAHAAPADLPLVLIPEGDTRPPADRLASTTPHPRTPSPAPRPHATAARPRTCRNTLNREPGATPGASPCPHAGRPHFKINCLAVDNIRRCTRGFGSEPRKTPAGPPTATRASGAGPGTSRGARRAPGGAPVWP